MTRQAGLTLVLSALLLTPLLAQQPTMSTFMTGVNPQNLNFTPLDTSKALQPRSNTASAFRSPSPMRAFDLGRYFPRIQLPMSWPPTIGRSTLPKTVKMPTIPASLPTLATPLPTMTIPAGLK